jgi:hypothetical protein
MAHDKIQTGANSMGVFTPFLKNHLPSSLQETYLKRSHGPRKGASPKKEERCPKPRKERASLFYYNYLPKT